MDKITRLLITLCVLYAQSAGAAGSPAQWVNPFIGTTGAGGTYPGAQAPFGMISPSPNTEYANYGDGSSRTGYDYNGKRVVSFTLTHASGVGLHADQDLPFTPCVGDLPVSPVGNRGAYASSFTAAQQKASPGFYQVLLETCKTQVSIAAATRSAIVRLDYPATAKANVIFCPSSCGTGISDSSLTISPGEHEVSGWAASGDFGDAPFHLDHHPYRVYFAAVFDHPFAGYGTWQGEAKRGGQAQAGGTDGAAFVRFDCKAQTHVLMRLGISYVSVADAQDNLAQEIPAWDFARVRTATLRYWNTLLDRIRVSGGRPQEMRSFYTAIYHNALQPCVFDDVSGSYTGFDHKVHQIAAGHHLYATFSLWDTYRSTAILQALIAPERASDMAQSLLLDSVQAPGGGLPTWALNDNDTGCMGTYSADPFIANVYAFGARNFDLTLAKQRMVLTATHQMQCGDGGAWWGNADYQTLGWRPGGASETLEYAVDDFSVAQICRAAGDTVNYQKFLARSQNAFHIFNPQVGYMQSRAADGSWNGPFSPSTQRGFTEGCAAQYTWMVPQNFAGLIALLGGPAKAQARLDDFFDPIVTDGWNTGVPHFWLGNEPTMETPYLYNWLGVPWKSQRLVRTIMASTTDTPGGYPGNDDLGAMSALYVFSALGLNPSIPGVGGFTVTSPLFLSAEIALAGGKAIRIHAANTGVNSLYIQSLMLNHNPCSHLWLTWAQLTAGAGATLDFALGSTPNRAWGTAPQDAPPSYSAELFKQAKS